jgi:DNA polymerase I-like protein with 3'-5' exonuclease and polymerase domains
VLTSLDIETACGVGCTTKCEHALDEHRNVITRIAIWNEEEKGVWADIFGFKSWLSSHPNARFVGHNLKFDLRTLHAKGLDLRARWAADTLLMAATFTEKVSDDWLRWYEQQRKIKNKALPKGYSHREGSKHSLKTLAPYFLSVEPFWEDPTNHANDEYVLKDCEYTYKLCLFLMDALTKEGSLEFYKDKLLPWTRMLLDVEIRGITIDLTLLDQLDDEAKAKAAEAKRVLDEHWADAYGAYSQIQLDDLQARYMEMADRAQLKAKDKVKCYERYKKLFQAAKEKLPTQLNLDSPAQLNWLLKDYLKLDITDFDGEETTGKPVLQRLAGKGREDIKTFLDYRKARKLTTAFFPSYREMQVGGILHTSFNPTGTRTGRLSSSRPNLQQVERGIHRIFRARPNCKLLTKDESAIEPRLIAFYSHDLHLYDIISKGEDFHGYNTKIFFDLTCDVAEIKKQFSLEREVGKEAGLAIMYGAGSNRLQESAMKRGFTWTLKECRYKVDRFREFYEGVFKFRDEVINPTLMQGESVISLLGRHFTISDPENVHMQGLNTLIQSSASDLVVHSAHRAMRAFKEQGIDAHVLLLVHDEIVVEVAEPQVKEADAILTHCMTDYNLPTPFGPIKLAVEGGTSDTWSKA